MTSAASTTPSDRTKRSAVGRLVRSTDPQYVPIPQSSNPITYPEHFELRLVSANGGIRWLKSWVNVSHLLGGLYVGFEEIDYGLFDVYFGPVWLGRFVEAKRRILDHFIRLTRHSPQRPKRP
jgi:hypothetical protein